jgi:hypothetical protein
LVGSRSGSGTFPVRNQAFRVVFVTPIIWAASAVDRYCEFLTAAAYPSSTNIFDTSCFNYHSQSITQSSKLWSKWVSKSRTGDIIGKVVVLLFLQNLL